MLGRSRTRRALKWIGVVLCALLVVLCAYAATHTAGVRYPHWRIFLDRGRLVIIWIGGSKVQFPPEWVNDRSHREVRLDIDLSYVGTGHVLGSPVVDVAVPLWIPFVLTGTPTAYLWYRDRRGQRDHGCPHCGYNLTGNVSGRCPECGSEIDAKRAEPANDKPQRGVSQ